MRYGSYIPHYEGCRSTWQVSVNYHEITLKSRDFWRRISAERLLAALLRVLEA